MERRTEKIGIFAPGMMTPEQYRLLLTPEVRRTVEEQIGRDPAAIALDKRIPHAALVATQVKYLARARTKLPSYYEARCILPPLAFEQASSEACAARKNHPRTGCDAGGRRRREFPAAGRNEYTGYQLLRRGVPRLLSLIHI